MGARGFLTLKQCEQVDFKAIKCRETDVRITKSKGENEKPPDRTLRERSSRSL